MNAIYDLSGAQVKASKEYDIATTTAIQEGAIVKLSAGKIVLAAVNESAAILGVAAENHSGSGDAFNPRANGAVLLVKDSPSAVLADKANPITVSGGVANTSITCNNATLAAGADDDFNGGYLKLISKGAGSAITDAVGAIYEITDYTAATKVFAVSGLNGTPTANDVVALFPPIKYAKGVLNATAISIGVATANALSLEVCGRDIKLNKVYWKAKLHSMSADLS